MPGAVASELVVSWFSRLAEPVLVLPSPEQALRLARLQVAELLGLQGAIRLRVLGAPAILDHRALVVLEAHLPVTGVGAHAGEVGAFGQCAIEGDAHLARPILVVP